MFLVAGVNVVSPIWFVEGSAGRAGLVAHYSSQTASAYGMQLHFLQQLPSVGVFLVLLSFVSGMLVCLESYFPSLASVVEAMRGVAGLNTLVFILVTGCSLLAVSEFPPSLCKFSILMFLSCCSPGSHESGGFSGLLLENLSLRVLTHFSSSLCQ